MDGLGAKSGEAAVEDMKIELAGGKVAFDPLMSMHHHWTGNALQQGGLYIMNIDLGANPDNEGHYCPLCEYEKYMKDFDAKRDIGVIADQMREHAIQEGLIPAPS